MVTVHFQDNWILPQNQWCHNPAKSKKPESLQGYISAGIPRVFSCAPNMAASGAGIYFRVK